MFFCNTPGVRSAFQDTLEFGDLLDSNFLHKCQAESLQGRPKYTSQSQEA